MAGQPLYAAWRAMIGVGGMENNKTGDEARRTVTLFTWSVSLSGSALSVYRSRSVSPARTRLAATRDRMAKSASPRASGQWANDPVSANWEDLSLHSLAWVSSVQCWVLPLSTNQGHRIRRNSSRSSIGPPERETGVRQARCIVSLRRRVRSGVGRGGLPRLGLGRCRCRRRAQ